MSMEIEGLSEFQRDLLDVAQRRLPRETYKIMRKIGSKARTQVAKHARSKVKKDSGNYHKKFKRGRVFKDAEGQIVVRVINSAPHGHLIEYGHRQVTKDGHEIGFVPGKKVMEQGMGQFESSGTFDNMLSTWLDELLDSGDL
ncbi:hypothetical protein BK128_21545 [Viridibacillus sp. FSL H7-0596]|nr:hypothetical protein BK128_21545 [Viridibacillus sp. FSL H7-0596]